MDSILETTKKKLGLESDNISFDTDIIDGINSVFATLNQLGVGPVEGFEIHDTLTTWGSFSTNLTVINYCKEYVYLKVRCIFDPPNSSVSGAMLSVALELESRILYILEGAFNDPTP